MIMEQIKVTKNNLYDVITDDDVYVIMYDRVWERGPKMEKITKCEIQDILESENIIVRIYKEES